MGSSEGDEPNISISSNRSKVAPLSESQIELAICHLLKSRGVFFWKQPNAGYYDASQKRFRRHSNPFVALGVPDLICIIKGRFVAFEVKTRVGRQSDNQKEFEQRVRRAEGLYYVVRSIDDVVMILQSLKGIL